MLRERKTPFMLCGSSLGVDQFGDLSRQRMLKDPAGHHLHAVAVNAALKP